MDFGELADKAKQIVDDRGGVDALKEDLQEATDAVKGEGSLTDKAKGVADAVQGDADGDGR